MLRMFSNFGGTVAYGQLQGSVGNLEGTASYRHLPLVVVIHGWIFACV